MSTTDPDFIVYDYGSLSPELKKPSVWRSRREAIPSSMLKESDAIKVEWMQDGLRISSPYFEQFIESQDRPGLRAEVTMNDNHAAVLMTWDYPSEDFDAEGNINPEALERFCNDLPETTPTEAHYNQMPNGKKLVDE